MTLRDRDERGDRDFYLEVLATAETTRRMARDLTALAAQRGGEDTYSMMAETYRRTLTKDMPILRASAIDSGIPAEDLSPAIEAWARKNINEAEAGRVWQGAWNEAEDLPQWFVDGKIVIEPE